MSCFWCPNCRSEFYFDILITVICPNINHTFLVIFSVSGIICYNVFSFHRLAISAAQFLVVFDHFWIFNFATLLNVIVTYIKETIITKLQKLYSPPRNLRIGNKSSMTFFKKPLCTGNLLPTQNINWIACFNWWDSSEKMKNFGFHTSAIKWFKPSLSNRKNLACIDAFSDSGTLKYGVRKGFSLGMLLLLLPLNDLTWSLSEDGSYLYADVTCIFCQLIFLK